MKSLWEERTARISEARLNSKAIGEELKELREWMRDPEGRLLLGDGTLVNTHKFKHLDCTGARHSNPPLRLVRTEPCENRALRLRCAIA